MVHIPFNGDFWEGSIQVSGNIAGRSVRGNAFGELIHRYQVPQIEIEKWQTDAEQKGIELSWKLKNPDAGNPLTYQVELIYQQKTWLLAKDLKERKGHFILPKTFNFLGKQKIEIKVTGSSLDGTLVGQVQKFISL
jgi:hypothetical protein